MTSFLSTNIISNELWRLIREEWYSITDGEIELSQDSLDLRKDMLPPEECVSFNLGTGTSRFETICQVMEDLFIKMSIKDSHLFAGLVDQEAYNKINKRENLVEFRRDQGEKNSHFGLYYLTDDEQKILAVKSQLIHFLEQKITGVLGEDASFKSKLEILKERKKEINKEIKKNQKIIVNKVKDDCKRLGISEIKLNVKDSGEIELESIDQLADSNLQSLLAEISPLKIAFSAEYPQDLQPILKGLSKVKI